MLVLPTQIVGVLVLAFAATSYEGWKVFYLTPLVFSYGLLNCWATKFGYTPNMMTGNMQKITEVLFKCAHNAELSAKEKGDAVIMGLEVASYLSGVVSASILQHYASPDTPGGINGPMLVVLPVVPLKLLASRTIQLRSKLGELRLPEFLSRFDNQLNRSTESDSLHRPDPPRLRCDGTVLESEV